MRPGVLLIIVAASVGLAGCGGPEVTVRHALEADLPVPDAAAIFVGKVAVISGEGDSYGPFVAARLGEQLGALPGRRITDSPQAADLAVSAQVTVQTTESKGTRAIRRFNPQRRRVEVPDAPTLVRTAAVRVDFLVADAKTGEKLAAAETRQGYNSADDPRTRGPLGLDRADGPAHVPPTRTIVRELLSACVETFADMIRPRQVVATAKLRGTLNPDGGKGLAAAGRGDLAQAVEHLSRAVKAEPKDPNLLFNLALCAEATGKLDLALANYEAAVRRTAGRDQEAAQAADRVRRVLNRMKK